MLFVPFFLVSVLAADCVQDSASTKAPQSLSVTLRVEQAEAHEILRMVAEQGEANIVIAPEVTGQVTLALRDVPWRTALDTIAEHLGCVVEDYRGVLRVSVPAKDLEGPRVRFNFLRADIREVVSTIARLAGANVVLDPAVRGEVTVYLKDIPWREALEIIVETSGCKVESVGDDNEILRILKR